MAESHELKKIRRKLEVFSHRPDIVAIAKEIFCKSSSQSQEQAVSFNSDMGTNNRDRHKRPDLGTVVTTVSAVVAILLFLEERNRLTVSLLLVDLFFMLLPLVGWALAYFDRLYARPKKMWFISCLVCVILVSMYGIHAWPDTSYDPVRLRQMSVAELKQAEGRLATKMRAFQTKQDRRMLKIMATTGHTEMLDSYEVDFTGEFDRDYLDKMDAIRAELLWRLGATEDVEEQRYPSSMLPKGYFMRAFEGLLAGPSPVADAAQYLDFLAEQLH